MYYTVYVNEQMLLDNFKFYNESNKLLRKKLWQTGWGIDRCVSEYKRLMTGRERLNNESLVTEYFKRCNNDKYRLRQVNSVKLYQSDFDYIIMSIKKFDLSKTMIRVLFGVIFFCRMNGTDRIDLSRDRDIKGFCGCFKSCRISDERIDGENWWETYHAPFGMQVLADCGVIEQEPYINRYGVIGCAWKYPMFYDHDNFVAYEFKTTLENNRLDLGAELDKIGFTDVVLCEMCGEPMVWSSKRMRLHCPHCAVIANKENSSYHRHIKRLENCKKIYN